MIIAHHLILTGYGHWLPNDPRGSMSLKTYAPQLAQLAEAHFGRKDHQPSREELRNFYRVAAGHLSHGVLWFDDAERQVIAHALGKVIEAAALTCYACVVLSNHVHLLVRKHKLKGEQMSSRFKATARDALRQANLAPEDHLVFSADCCDMYKSTPEQVRRCIGYVHDNFQKHRIVPVRYDFVQPCDNWPFHKRRQTP